MAKLRKIIGIILTVASIAGAVFVLFLSHRLMTPIPDCGIRLTPIGVDPKDWNPCGISFKETLQLIVYGIVVLLVFAIGIFLLIYKKTQIAGPEKEAVSNEARKILITTNKGQGTKTFLKVLGIIFSIVIIYIIYMFLNLHLIVNIKFLTDNPEFQLGETTVLSESISNYSIITHTPGELKGYYYLDGKIIDLPGHSFTNIDPFFTQVNQFNITFVNENSKLRNNVNLGRFDIVVGPGKHVLELVYGSRKSSVVFTINEDLYTKGVLDCDVFAGYYYRQIECQQDKAKISQDPNDCTVFSDTYYKFLCFSEIGKCQNVTDEEEREVCYKVQKSPFGDPNVCSKYRPIIPYGKEKNYEQTDFYCFDLLFKDIADKDEVEVCNLIENPDTKKACFEYIVFKKDRGDLCDTMKDLNYCIYSDL